MNTTALARQVFTVEAELEEACLCLQEMPDDATDDQVANVAAVVADYLAAAEHQRDRFCEFLSYLESLEAAARAEEKRLADRRRSIAAARERLEQMAVRAMEARGVRKLEGVTHTISLRKSPGKLEHDATAPDAPMEYREYIVRVPGDAWDYLRDVLLAHSGHPLTALIIGGATWTAKNDLIKSDLKAGIDVPGYSIATPNSLQIK